MDINDRFRPGAPMPDSLGLCADLYADVREQRLAMEKFVAEGIKARETEIRKHMQQVLAESTDTGASGLVYRVQLVRKTGLRATDWSQVFAFVQQHGAFEILQKRLSEPAVRELAESGVTIPGVEAYTYDDLSITKR